MKEFSNLAKVVYRRTYSRKDNGYLENWDQTVERVIAGNVKGKNVPEAEIKELLRLAKERKAGPAGRGYWFSGAPSHEKIGGAALNNCWFLTADDWYNFVIAQDLLMLGGGVGLSVEHRFTSKLSRVRKDVVIVHKATKDADFIIPDSREGWCELTFRCLESFFVTGKSFSYSTVCLRGSGEPIVGFGGVSSGPLPLVEYVKNLCSILVSRAGKAIRPIDAADIITSIGKMVVSGNVRRSAIIILGDCWDKEYLKAKRWDLGQIPDHRSKANYSVVCDDVEDLHPSFWKTYEQGEPFGIVNRTNIQRYGRMGELKPDTAIGVNPSLRAGTKVWTTHGIVLIESLQDTSFTIRNLYGKLSVAKCWLSGHDKPLYKITLSNGFEYYCTAEHKWPIYTEFGYVKVETTDLKPGHLLPIQKHTSLSGDFLNKKGNGEDGFLAGWIQGDGWVSSLSDGRTQYGFIVSEEDTKEGVLERLLNHLESITGKRYEGSVNGTSLEFNISDSRLHERMQSLGFTGDKEKLPEMIWTTATEEFRKGFIDGFYSSDGYIEATNPKRGRIGINSSRKGAIEDLQELLGFYGIKTGTINHVELNNAKFPNGKNYDKVYHRYELRISDRANVAHFAECFKLTHARKNRDLINISKEKGRRKVYSHHYEVESVELTDLKEDVWDIEVLDTTHCFQLSQVTTGNCAEATLENGEPCNLTETALCNIQDGEELLTAVRLMQRYAKRVTLEHYHHELSSEVIKRNRRTGNGITGCLASSLFNPDTLDRAYFAVQEEDEKYSKELGVPRSKRTTVVKPSGTMSKVLDCQGYEGIHAAYSRYMIQRVRFASNDPLLPKLRSAGHYMEPVNDFGTIDPGTMVVDFYQQAPDGYPVADEDWTTWRQLDILKMAQKHWADQSVSVTVYYRREELPQLKQWISDNLQYLKTISFLCHSEHGFKQAPKEAISKERFEKLSSKIKAIEFEDVSEGNLVPDMECEGGACPIR